MLEVNVRFHRDAFLLEVDTQFTAGVTGVFGPSGCGKSTLLSVIAGLLKPEQGFIKLNDQVLLDSRAKLCVPSHQRHLGMVFQDGQLFPHLRVKKNLEYGFNHLVAHQRRFKPQMVIELLELSHLMARLPHELSGGEKQRVALGRAILFSPALLLLDEPLSALDSRLKDQILAFLVRVKEELKIPMIYVSHDLREIDRIADASVEMIEGRIKRL